MSDANVDQILGQMRVMRDQARSESKSSEASADFAALFRQSIDRVNETQQQAGKLARAFEMGDADASLPEVMIALQKASISFQAMVQVRNKLVEAYKDIMNMQM